MSGLPEAEMPVIAEGITQGTIDDYAELSGDFNPLHVDPVAAAESEFGGTIAHGPIALHAFLRSLTEWLDAPAPPPGTSVKVTYRHPVRPGDTIRCELRGRSDEASMTSIEAECVNQDDTTVLSVTASVPASGSSS